MNVFDQETANGKLAIAFIWKHRITLVIAIIIGSVGAAGVTYFIKPEYRSTGIIFPTNSNKLESVMANPQFGFDLDADRLMQILESRQVQDAVVEKFNLEEYYELDTTEAEWRGELNLEFVKDITFFRSKFCFYLGQIGSNLISGAHAIADTSRQKKGIIITTTCGI